MELILVIGMLAALAVFAAVGIFGALNTFTLNSATTQVVNHIRYTQQLARTHNGWYGIRFEANPTNRYTVYSTDGTTDTPVPDPADPGRNLVINIDDAYDGVYFTNIDLGGGNTVEFNPRGIPYDDKNGSAFTIRGRVFVRLRGSRIRIRIRPVSGRVETY